MSAISDYESVTIRHLDSSKDIITLGDAEIIMMGTNIEAVVVTSDDIKYINWANIGGVTSDEYFVVKVI